MKQIPEQQGNKDGKKIKFEEELVIKGLRGLELSCWSKFLVFYRQ